MYYPDLTPTENRILAILKDLYNQTGINHIVTDLSLRNRFGYKSYAAPSNNIKSLERKGYVKRIGTACRGMPGRWELVLSKLSESVEEEPSLIGDRRDLKDLGCFEDALSAIKFRLKVFRSSWRDGRYLELGVIDGEKTIKLVIPSLGESVWMAIPEDLLAKDWMSFEESGD